MDYTRLVGKGLTTVVSYPERDEPGKTYGDPGWAGNCSGLLVRDLLQFYRSTHFRGRDIVVADIMAGSGTVFDVCEELGIECDAYDLNPSPRRGVGNWNARCDEMGRSPDVIFVHPPYWDVYRYSRDVWSCRTPNPEDLSEIPDYWDFIKAWNEVQLRHFADLKTGGLMMVLVGDIKRRGVLYSMQRDMAWLGTPKQVIIKLQHNTQSDRRTYAGRFIPIVHEYLVVMEKEPGHAVTIRKTVTVNYDVTRWVDATWRTLVRYALERLGKKATLASIYEVLADTPKARKNQHWRERIRATLQTSPDFEPLGGGVWRLAA